MGETRLGLVRAYLSLTAGTPFAAAAATHERRGDPITDVPAPDVGAHRDHFPDQFMSGYVRECDAVIVPGPGMPVTAAQPGRMHLHHHATGRRRRVRDGPDVHRPAELLEDRRTHQAIVPSGNGGPATHPD